MLNRIEKAIAGDLQGWPRRNAIAAFRRQLTFALMAFIGKQLRVAEDALPDESLPMPPAVVPGAELGGLFTEAELARWEADQEEELFVGPIRIRGRRPAPCGQVEPCST